MTGDLEVTHRYLHLPVRTGAPQRKVAVAIGEAVIDHFDIDLAEGDPEWWAFLDLAPYRGQTLTVTVEGDASEAVLERFHQSDEIVDADEIYREVRRPQLRFSSRRGWFNDPNGLVFYEGEYHLFYQHNPYGWSWGNMHWGHAVSRDLVHWNELPAALYPDEFGGAYTGSIVVDWFDTAGFRTGDEPALVAVYTAGGDPHVQCVASSNDRGRTWQKYEGNPVLPSLTVRNRDSKVFWYAPGDVWVMALYLDELNPDDHPELTKEMLDANLAATRYGIFHSHDLKHWEKVSEFPFPHDADCPELFELPIEGGAPGETRWIFLGGFENYFVGTFDGTTFTPESGPHRLNQGDSMYASQLYNELPTADGRRILMSWSPGAAGRPPSHLGMPFNRSMNLPVVLTLRRTADGIRMLANPIAELASLRAATTSIPAGTLAVGDDPLAGLTGELWELDVELAVGDATRVVLHVGGVSIGYDAATQQLTCLEKSAPLALNDGRMRLRLFVDRAAIDIFAGDGLVYMPMDVDLTAKPPTLSLSADGGTARIVSAQVHELSSIWNGPDGMEA